VDRQVEARPAVDRFMRRSGIPCITSRAVVYYTGGEGGREDISRDFWQGQGLIASSGPRLMTNTIKIVFPISYVNINSRLAMNFSLYTYIFALVSLLRLGGSPVYFL
jgi:hypothetical protein